MNRKLIFEFNEGDSEYVYSVEPQYDEDGVHMCCRLSGSLRLLQVPQVLRMKRAL